MSGEATVLARRQGRIGRLTLNRPKALNALDGAMIGALAAALDAWKDAPAVHAVVIEGAGGRAFCAGGDIRQVRTAILEGRHGDVAAFFRDEYRLNQVIADFPKPFIALVDGICMGGGIGVSVHGDVRVATEAALFAMPETGIALFPDIGASFILPRLRGHAGMFLALTGARLHGADAAFVGLATHFTGRDTLATLADELAAHGPAALAGIARPVEAPIAAHMEAIDRCFSAPDVAGIRQRLADTGTDWSRDTLATLDAVSPSAVEWTFRLIRAGATRTLPQCLAAELALTAHVTRHPDFAEGVRAMVVDKDRTPRWQLLDLAAVEAMFA